MLSDNNSLDKQAEHSLENPTDRTHDHCSPRLFSAPCRAEWWRRWWTLVLLLTLCSLVLMGVVLYFAILPAVVREQASKITVTTSALRIAHPGDSSFEIAGQQELSQVPLSPCIDSFTALLSDMSGQPLFKLHLPAFCGQSLTIPQQNVTILNTTAYTIYATQVITDEHVYLRAYGTTKVHVLGRAVAVEIEKIVVLGGLKDMYISIDSVQSSDSLLLSKGTTSYTGSVLSLDTGLTQFKLLYKGAAISELYSMVSLKPGRTSMSTLGKATVTGLSSRPDLVREISVLAKSGQDIPVTIQGYENLNAAWANTSIRALTKETVLANQDFRTAVSTLGPAVMSILGL